MARLLCLVKPGDIEIPACLIDLILLTFSPYVTKDMLEVRSISAGNVSVQTRTLNSQFSRYWYLAPISPVPPLWLAFALYTHNVGDRDRPHYVHGA